MEPISVLPHDTCVACNQPSCEEIIFSDQLISSMQPALHAFIFASVGLCVRAIKEHIVYVRNMVAADAAMHAHVFNLHVAARVACMAACT